MRGGGGGGWGARTRNKDRNSEVLSKKGGIDRGLRLFWFIFFFQTKPWYLASADGPGVSGFTETDSVHHHLPAHCLHCVWTRPW